MKHNTRREIFYKMLTGVAGATVLPSLLLAQNDTECVSHVDSCPPARWPQPDPTILAEAKKAAEALSQRSDAGLAKPADVAAFRANLAVLFHHTDAIKLTEAYERTFRSRPEITKEFLDRPVIAGKTGYMATYAEKFAITEFSRQHGVHALQERILDQLQGVVDQDFSPRRVAVVRFPVPPYIEPNVCHDLQDVQTELEILSVFAPIGGWLVVGTMAAAVFSIWRFRVNFC